MSADVDDQARVQLTELQREALKEQLPVIWSGVRVHLVRVQPPTPPKTACGQDIGPKDERGTLRKADFRRLCGNCDHVLRVTVEDARRVRQRRARRRVTR